MDVTPTSSTLTTDAAAVAALPDAPLAMPAQRLEPAAPFALLRGLLTGLSLRHAKG